MSDDRMITRERADTIRAYVDETFMKLVWAHEAAHGYPIFGVQVGESDTLLWIDTTWSGEEGTWTTPFLQRFVNHEGDCLEERIEWSTTAEELDVRVDSPPAVIGQFLITSLRDVVEHLTRRRAA